MNMKPFVTIFSAMLKWRISFGENHFKDTYSNCNLQTNRSSAMK